MSSSYTASIPSEILSDIFLKYSIDAKGVVRSSGPICLGLVCRRWRAITLNTLALWTAIKVKGYGASISPYIPAIRNWLSRSSTLPCDICVSLKGLNMPLVVLGMLHPIASRLQHLKLCVELEELTECLELLNGGLPSLRSLDLSLARRRRVDNDIPDVPAFPLNLSGYLQLEDVNISFDLTSLVGPPTTFIDILPASLKSFCYLLELSPLEIVQLLSKCRHLEFFLLEDWILSWTQHLPDDTPLLFSHTAMSVFDLMFDAPGIRPLFRAIQFPGLVELTLGRCPDPEGILELIADAMPPLEVLTLWRFPITTDELLEFFERISTIRQLTLQHCDLFNTPLISALTILPDRSIQLLPKLTYFCISQTRADSEQSAMEIDVSDQDLVAFVESRWRVQVEGISKIESIDINDDREMEQQYLERISLMSSEGLVCHLQGMERRAGLARLNEWEDHEGL